MKTYLVRVKHDNGIVRIKTVANSRDSAIQNVMIAENCPLSAILSANQANTAGLFVPGKYLANPDRDIPTLY